MTIHEYHVSEGVSQAYQRSNWYTDIMRKKWGAGVLYIIPKNDPRQMDGIDVIVCPNNLPRRFSLDNKFREKLWNDVLLEVYSNEETRRIGWTGADLKCDLIGYWYVEARGGFLISWPQLHSVWQENAVAWITEFGIKQSLNESGGRKWTTVNVPIPVREIEAAGIEIEWVEA